MTNRTDLDECSAQIRLVKRLTSQPETFELSKILIQLETKKKLLMTFKPRSYDTILKGLESGELIHPEIEDTKLLKIIEEAKRIEAEKLRAIEVREAQKETIEEVIKEVVEIKEVVIELTEEELAEIAKEEKIAELKAELEALETEEVEE